MKKLNKINNNQMINYLNGFDIKNNDYKNEEKLNKKVVFGILCNGYEFFEGKILPKLLKDIKSVSLENVKNDYRSGFENSNLIKLNVLLNKELNYLPKKIFENIYLNRNYQYEMSDSYKFIKNFNNICIESFNKGNVIEIEDIDKDLKQLADKDFIKENYQDEICILTYGKYFNEIQRYDEIMNPINKEKFFKFYYAKNSTLEKKIEMILTNINESNKNNVQHFLKMRKSYISSYNSIIKQLQDGRTIDENFVNEMHKCLDKFSNMRNYSANPKNNISFNENVDYSKNIRKIRMNLKEVKNLLKEMDNENDRNKFRKNKNKIKEICLSLFSKDFKYLNDSFNKDILFKYYYDILSNAERDIDYKKLSLKEKKMIFLHNIYEDFNEFEIKEFQDFCNKLERRNYFKIINYLDEELNNDFIDFHLDKTILNPDQIECKIDRCFNHFKIEELLDFLNNKILLNNFYTIDAGTFEKLFSNIIKAKYIKKYNEDSREHNIIFFNEYEPIF